MSVRALILGSTSWVLALSAAASQFTTVWQLGADDALFPPFSQESWGPNPPPGSPSVKDDDYYFAGAYPAPVGVVGTDENTAFVERALTVGDPRNRIHFPLTSAQASSASLLRVTVDLFNGGAWIDTSIPGFSSHDVTVSFNGHPVRVLNAITWDQTISITLKASEVSAVAGANVIQIERTGGKPGGYIGLDYIKLEADAVALLDADADGMAKWFEELYGFDDANPSDAALDGDGDGVINRDEFLAGTNPTDLDSDNDGLTDLQEEQLGTNPLKRDTDGDGLEDSKEIRSSPLLPDTDGDSHPDNIEQEQGSDPSDPASVPFDFPGAIGFQFISERQGAARLPAGEPAGLFRLPNWNASAALPQWGSDGTVLSGSQAALKNHRGQTTSAAISWSYHFSGEGLHKGPGDERLLDGMIRTQKTSAIDTPVTIDLTGIPFSSYDLLVYIGRSYPADSARGLVRLGDSAATDRFLNADSAPPFKGWREIKATTIGAISPGNYVRYRGLTGSTKKITLRSLDNQPIAIHGLQMIDSATDTDGDGMPDAMEVEHRFNPAVRDAMADADADGMTNAGEIVAGTDPHHSDTDRDGILDGAEAALGTSPLNPDSDGDTLTDGGEINANPFPSSPTKIDSDGDGFTDPVERAYNSDPLSATSTPPPVPVWNAGTRTWLWRIDNLRVLWNHEQSMLGAIGSDETMLCEAVADINQSGWSRQLGIGIRYVNGKLLHRFRGVEGVFHQSGNVNAGFWDSDWRATPVDRTRDFGFSGYGLADDSIPLRFEFSAVQPAVGVNKWTIRFSILDMGNQGTPLASYTNTSAVAADASLLAGTTVWKSRDGAVGRMDLATEAGVLALITPNAPGIPDQDSDGMPDAWEMLHSLNPASTADAILDPDSDGLSNVREYLAGTNPRLADTDGDMASDGLEISHGSDPLSPTSVPPWFNFSGKVDDLDGDGVSDAWILWSGGKPRVASWDDDGDGASNLAESLAGTDPDDADSLFDLKTWREGNDLILSWTDLPNKSQGMDFSGQLNSWSPLAGVSSASSVGGRKELGIAGEFLTAEKRFFRASAGARDSDGDGVEDWVEASVLESSLSSPASLGQSMGAGTNRPLSGDAIALLERLQGASPSGGTPDTTAPGKPSPLNASRFLMQSTFGPTRASIHEVQDLGYSAWIDRQIGLPPSWHQPYIKEIKADAAGPRIDSSYNFNELDRFVHGNNVTTPFARNAIMGEDQLRQRVAFALSQILVVSRRDANLEEKTEAITHYYDTLVRHALGNYGDLLKEVTFHPAMGWYLSHAGNQKADPSIPRYPDENYAREVMQLFTIGLWELNPDGSRKLDSSGEPIPTYDNGVITEVARVFTGLYYASPYGWGGGGWADEHFTVPMVMYADRHDFEAKHLLHGVVIPAREANEENGLQDVKDAVEALFRHPNTPPFVCRQLIQFLVTDNPSPGYIRRIQDVFVDDGHGVRGNLGAVVKAILLDAEVRNPPLSESFGKVREPVVRTMHLARLLDLGKTHPEFVWWNWSENYYSSSIQEPMNSPSVFNFYAPGYQAPGEIRNSGLVSPGFQIINTYSAVSFPNLMWDYLHDGLKAGYGLSYPMDYSALLLIAEQPPALVDEVNLLVCSGSMTARTRGILLTALENPALSRKDRVALALWTALSSPEGVVQK